MGESTLVPTLLSLHLNAVDNMAAAGAIGAFSLLMAVVAAFYDQVSTFNRPDLNDFVLCALLSALGFAVTFYFVPIVKELMLRNNMWGYDINKNGKELNIRVYAKKRDIFASTDLRVVYPLSAHHNPLLIIANHFNLTF